MTSTDSTLAHQPRLPLRDELDHRVAAAVADITQRGWEGGVTLQEIVEEYALGEYTNKLARRVAKFLRANGWLTSNTTRRRRPVRLWIQQRAPSTSATPTPTPASTRASTPTHTQTPTHAQTPPHAPPTRNQYPIATTYPHDDDNPVDPPIEHLITITRRDLAYELRRALRNSSPSDGQWAETAVKTLFSVIGDAMVLGQRVELRGLGTFGRQWRAPRTGRNPHTGQAVPIPGRWRPYFKPGKVLLRRMDAGITDESNPVTTIPAAVKNHFTTDYDDHTDHTDHADHTDHTDRYYIPDMPSRPPTATSTPITEPTPEPTPEPVPGSPLPTSIPKTKKKRRRRTVPAQRTADPPPPGTVAATPSKRQLNRQRPAVLSTTADPLEDKHHKNRIIALARYHDPAYREERGWEPLSDELRAVCLFLGGCEYCRTHDDGGDDDNDDDNSENSLQAQAVA